jgi:hypothetical protein
MSSTLLTSCLSALFVCIGVKVIVMNVLWSVLSVDCVGDSVEPSVWNEFPASLRLVCKKDVGSIVPSQPSIHFLREMPNMAAWFLMKPMVQWVIKVVGMSVDLSRELSLKPWEYVVELQSVRVQEHPS